jgi:hypothetical protein
MIFLIDEIEAHLHPKWQRSIVKALLNVVKTLTGESGVQVITATHSPLVLASVEPFFDPEKDAWFDLDSVTGKEGKSRVELSRRQFVRHGDASNWLVSEAFDLPSARSLEAEKILQEAAGVMSSESFDAGAARELEKKLRTVLGDTDSFWMRWRFVAETKGWFR